MSYPSKNVRLLVVVLAAVCIVVFQALAGSVAARAASPALDAFGNPLCIGHIPDETGADAPAKKNAAIPDCCTVACGLFLAAMPVLFTDAGLLNPFSEAARPAFRNYGLLSGVPPDHRPGYPRAPPTFT